MPRHLAEARRIAEHGQQRGLGELARDLHTLRLRRREWPRRSPGARLRRARRRGCRDEAGRSAPSRRRADRRSAAPAAARCARSIPARATDVVESSLPVRSRCSQPSTELSGVRSSWEMVARNSSFMRPADSVSRRATWASRACSSATRRARRSSETSAVRSRPCTTKSARCVPVARTFPAASGCHAPTRAPVTVAASAGPVPANHALAMTAVASRRNRLPSSITRSEGPIDDEHCADCGQRHCEAQRCRQGPKRVRICSRHREQPSSLAPAARAPRADRAGTPSRHITAVTIRNPRATRAGPGSSAAGEVLASRS